MNQVENSLVQWKYFMDIMRHVSMSLFNLYFDLEYGYAPPIS